MALHWTLDLGHLPTVVAAGTIWRGMGFIRGPLPGGVAAALQGEWSQAVSEVHT